MTQIPFATASHPSFCRPLPVLPPPFARALLPLLALCPFARTLPALRLHSTRPSLALCPPFARALPGLHPRFGVNPALFAMFSHEFAVHIANIAILIKTT